MSTNLATWNFEKFFKFEDPTFTAKVALHSVSDRKG